MGETGQDKSLRPGAPSPIPHVSSQEWSFRQIGPWHLPAKITLLLLPGTLGSKPNAHPWFTGLTWAGRCFLLSSALDMLVPCWTCSSYSEHPSFSSTQHSLFLQPGTFHLPSLSPGKLLLIPQASAEMVPPLWSIPDHAQLRQPLGFSPSLEPPQSSAPHSTATASFPCLHIDWAASTSRQGFAFIPSVVLENSDHAPFCSELSMAQHRTQSKCSCGDFQAPA